MYSNKELRARRKFQWHNAYTISSGVELRLGKECRQRELPDIYRYATRELPMWMAISSNGKKIAKMLEEHARMENMVEEVEEPLKISDTILTKHKVDGFEFYIASVINALPKIDEFGLMRTPMSVATRIFVEKEIEYEMKILASEFIKYDMNSRGI